MRQIALDTETTGIGHELGHRVIEIGCVEIINRRVTGRTFHTYLNPQRAVDEGAFKVHGISDAFLRDKPLFPAVLSDFLAFVDQAELIIHNAVFDMGFLNSELRKIRHPKVLESYCSVIDTLMLARKKHPGQRNSLDALCKRYDIDNSHRQWHGALLDAHILAQVYLAMTGGQTDLFGDPGLKSHDPQTTVAPQQVLISDSPVYYATPEELQRHQAFVDELL